MQLPRNIDTLTGVRGYAALWVVFFHLKTDPYFLALWTPGPFIRAGFWGVDVFFVLSGFVLSHVYESKFAEKVDLKEYLHYLGLRLARMYPLHLVTFLAALGLVAVSHSVGNASLNGSFYDAVMNLALLHAWGTTSGEGFNTVSWSISAEWFAYLFLLIPCLRVLRKVPLPALYLLTGVVWSLLILVYVPLTPSKVLNMTAEFGVLRIVPEFLGGYVAFQTVKKIHNLPYLFDLMGLAGFTGIIVVTLHTQLQILLLPVCMLFLIGLSGEGPIAYRVFGNRASLFLGETSYSIYMSHFMLLWIVNGIAKRAEIPILPWAGLSVVGLYLVLLIVVSYALYATVERSCRRWGRRTLDNLLPKVTEANHVPVGISAGLVSSSASTKDL
jgi:peptidoglycan/LPS O-acetylase OafA/YrhL